MTPATVVPLALAPRRAEARCTRVEAAQLLEVERTIAAGLAVRAIAEGWDTGRIARPQPGLRREGEVFALLGIASGLADRQLHEAHAMLDAVMRQGRTVADSIHRLKPMDELVDEFGLSYLARMILSLVVAPRIYGEIAQLYAIAANHPRGDVVNEHLLRLLLGPRHVSPHDLAHELSASRPLVRHGLLRRASSTLPPFTPLAPDPMVIERLRGHALDRDPLGALAIVTARVPFEELRLAPAIRAQIVTAVSRTTQKPLRMVVRGRDGSGRRTLLAALAGLANRRLAMIDLDQFDDSAQPHHELQAALARCALAGWIPCIDGMDHVSADDRAGRERLRRIIRDFHGPLGIRLDREAQAPIEAGFLQIDLPDLTETERLGVWQHELADQGVDAELAALAPVAARWRIGAGTIHRVVSHVVETSPVITNAVIDAAVGQQLELRLGQVAERIRRLPRLADMVLPAEVNDSLTEFLARLHLQRKVFEDWGMTKVATTGRGITALFSGPPGTGKTMVASALARELGIDIYRVDLSRVMSKFIGETEKNLGSVFSAAEESQAIILFDEADSLFTKRTEVKSSNDRFANNEVNYLLQRLDTFVGIAILTTNLATSIDPAFKRRLAFRVHFPIPDEELREQLWRSHLPPTIPTDGDLDLPALAHAYPLTGGSVRNCVLRAAFLAAAEDVAVSQAHLERAVRLEYRAAGKLSESGPLE